MLLPFLFTIKIIRDTTKINLTEANIGGTEYRADECIKGYNKGTEK
jgi:hypothetical protein